MGYFVSEGLTKKEADELRKDVAELKELVKGKQIKLEAMISLGLEKENITQDQLDSLINLLKSFGKQKGLKVD